MKESVWLLLLMILIRDDLCLFFCFVVRCLLQEQRRLLTQNSTTTATRSFSPDFAPNSRCERRWWLSFSLDFKILVVFFHNFWRQEGAKKTKSWVSREQFEREERRRSLDRSSTRLEAKDASGVTNEIRRREVLVERVSYAWQKSLLLRLKLQRKGRKRERERLMSFSQCSSLPFIVESRFVCPLLFLWTFLQASTKTITHPSYTSSVLILCREGKILVSLYWERKSIFKKVSLKKSTNNPCVRCRAYFHKNLSFCKKEVVTWVELFKRLKTLFCLKLLNSLLGFELLWNEVRSFELPIYASFGLFSRLPSFLWADSWQTSSRINFFFILHRM